MKKRIAMIMTAISVLVGGMCTPVSAQVVEDVNQTTEAEEQKEAQKETETKETKKEDEKTDPNKEDETLEMHEIIRRSKLTPEELKEILDRSPLTKKSTG